MVDVSKYKSTSVPGQPAAPAPEPGFLGAISNFATETVPNFFTGADRTEFPEMEELGTMQGGLDYDVLAALSADESQAANIAAQQSGGKLRLDKYKNFIIDMPDGESYYINKPGVSGRDIKDIGTQGLMFIPAARVAGAAVKTGSLMTLGAATAAGGATQTAAEIATNMAGGGQSSGGVLMDTVTAMAATPLGATGNFGRTAAVQNLPDQALQQANRAKDLAGETNVGLLTSQVGPSRQAEAKIQYLREQPTTSYRMDGALQEQSEQAQGAVQGILNELPESPTGLPGVQARDAAEKTRQAQVDARREATEQQYQVIRDSDKIVRTDDLVQSLRAIQRQDKLVEAGGSYKAIDRVIDLVGRGEKSVQKTAPGSSIDDVVKVETGISRQPGHLLDAKLEIDDLIEIANNTGNTKQVRELMKAKESLVSTLDDVTDGGFTKANSIFETLSQPINAIDDGLAGMLLNMPTAQLDFVVAQVFAPKAGRTARANLKRVLDQSDPNSYGALLRAHLQDKLDTIKDTQIDANVPNDLLNALWKNKSTRDMYRSELNAISPDAAKAYDALGEVLKYAKIGRGNNSNTQAKQNIERSMQALKNLVTGILEFSTGAGIVRKTGETIADIRKSRAADVEVAGFKGDIDAINDMLEGLAPGDAKAAQRNIVLLQAFLGGETLSDGPNRLDGALAE